MAHIIFQRLGRARRGVYRRSDKQTVTTATDPPTRLPTYGRSPRHDQTGMRRCSMLLLLDASARALGDHVEHSVEGVFRHERDGPAGAGNERAEPSVPGDHGAAAG